MKTRVRNFLVVLVFCVLCGLNKTVNAQCAMCSTAVESSSQSGASQTNGLNNGILFLLATPYLAVAICGYVWYKKFRRKDVEINMRDEKLHLN